MNLRIRMDTKPWGFFTNILKRLEINQQSPSGIRHVATYAIKQATVEWKIFDFESFSSLLSG